MSKSVKRRKKNIARPRHIREGERVVNRVLDRLTRTNRIPELPSIKFMKRFLTEPVRFQVLDEYGLKPEDFD